MNKFILLAAFAVVPVRHAFAQLYPLPPSSVTDGIPVRAKGINGGITHWDDPSGLAAYRFASDGNLGIPNMGSPDNVLGLRWAASAPASFVATRTDPDSTTFRAIFLGESAGWQNDFGYTFSGDPQGPDSFSVFRNISAVDPGSTLNFGDHVDIHLLPGENETFDFWFNAVGDFGTSNPTPPTQFGGVYTVFNPENSTPYIAPGNVRWAQSPLMVSTWIPAFQSYVDYPTYLVGIEDWRLDRGADNDGNDFVFAIQVFQSSGGSLGAGAPPPVGVGPIPESMTLGVAGGSLLAALASRRCIRKINSERTESESGSGKNPRSKLRGIGQFTL
jgi:hypothetical protein